MSNTFMKFIDSCVGAIARKVQDEFDESKHPRDKGGKFSSKGGEGRGGSTKTSKGSSKSIKTDVEVSGDTDGIKEEAAEYGVKAVVSGSDGHGSTSVKLSGAKEDVRRYLEEKIYGSEDEAREWNPEAYEGDEQSGSEGADGDDGDAHSAVELGSPEHKNIRQSYMSALTGSVPSLDSTVRVKWALDQVDNVIRRFGTESAKNRLMGIVYNVVGLKNSGDKGHVYKQLSDYIKEFE